MNDTKPAIAAAPAEADAGRRNMLLLMQLRWIAVGGQILTIALAEWGLGIRLPLAPLLMAPALLIAINLATLPLLMRREAVTNGELTFMLLIDVGALGWQLYYSGGLANPFASLFLLQVVIGAMLLRPGWSWTIVAASAIALGVLATGAVPLDLPPDLAGDPWALYLKGTLVCFALIAPLLVAFVTRISRNLRDRDAALATIRQRAAEEDHIVRMGLLASGAAHELGTPLSSLSVIIGDWQHIPALMDDPELRADIREMQTAVQRCKTIVGGILMSAGEARGIAPQVTTVRTFLDGIMGEWQSTRLPGTIDYIDRFGKDVAIVSDPALKQVIGNVIDNAVEVSPDRVAVTVMREHDALVIEVADHGPGFSPEMIEAFGQPYRSTKGKPGGGLGLFLLVNVLRKMGGEASAQNRDGGGAVVRLTLPLSTILYRDGAL